MGIDSIDKPTMGIRDGEVWVHAAYTGEYKTTFALNWCYALVTRYRRNVVYFSLESTRAQIRRSIAVLHSTHPKFQLMGYQPLDYGIVRRGELTLEDEAFFEFVMEDFENNPEYAHFHLETPDNGVGINEIRSSLLQFEATSKIGMVVIDHFEELKIRKNSQDRHDVALNKMYGELKDMALHWARPAEDGGGTGIPLLVLHQINRQGKDQATKNDGRYVSASALSWASAAEKVAFIVTTSWVDDDLRSKGQIRIQNLKSREDTPFPDVLLTIGRSKRLSYVSPERQMAIDEMTATEGGWDALDAALGAV